MGKIGKIFFSVCCILPLIGLVAFAEEGNPTDVPAVPALEDNTSHIDPTYVAGFVYVKDVTSHALTYSSTFGFNMPDEVGVDVGDVVVVYYEDAYIPFNVVEVGGGGSSNRTILEPFIEIPLVSIASDYYFQLYEPVEPLTFVQYVGDWIIGCFSTVALVLTGFATDNEWVTFFLLVIPLSGLIFTFVKSLIARR